jgi:hypothetical protein
LKNKTPSQVFKDNDAQKARHLNDRTHNKSRYKSVPFDTGDKVRILEKKKKLMKESKNSVIHTYIYIYIYIYIYAIDKKGYKLLVNGTSNKLKPA